MSLNAPVIPSMTLKGLNAKIQTIQEQLNTDLSWLDKSFGLADRIVEMKEEKPYVYPAIFESMTNDPISLMPCDIWNAFCFWVKNGDASFDYQDNYANKDPLIIYPVSCIFYIDIKAIDSLSDYPETKSEIIEDIFHFFNTLHFNGMLLSKKFTEDDITKVYAGFTLDQLDNKFKMYPKWCCRMDFDLMMRDACYYE